jgi:SAM-dependent methyltransferase
VQCRSCGSWNFISDIATEDENIKFYNDIYKELDSINRSKLKKKIFNAFFDLDRKSKFESYEKFELFYKSLSSLQDPGKKVLEIGFGPGRTLSKLLDAGVNAFGIDISDTAVDNFQKKYPQYKEKVFVGNRFEARVDTIFCSALFEHLENPTDFIVDASRSLERDGCVIIDALPCVNPMSSDLTVDDDVNFWKPFHKVIYSVEGIKRLFEKNGFELEKYGCLDIYNNRVLSLHISAGYSEIVKLRNSTFKSPGLPGIVKYYSLCRQATKIRSLALHSCFVFKKR